MAETDPQKNGSIIICQDRGIYASGTDPKSKRSKDIYDPVGSPPYDLSFDILHLEPNDNFPSGDLIGHITKDRRKK